VSFKDVIDVVSHFAMTTEALAAIGARVGIESEEGVDPRLVAALDAVLAAAGVNVGDLAPEERTIVEGAVRSTFRLATDLLDDLPRPLGWSIADPVVLNGLGRASGRIPILVAAAAPELADVTSFLDVGSGAGWLSIAAAAVWPQCSVVGIDPWEPALEQGRQNVARAGLEGRIALRLLDVIDLDDAEAYDGAWVPGSFLPEHQLPVALSNVVRSLRPGGWVVVGRYDEPPSDALANATMVLRTVRDGGCVLDIERATELLEAAGCAHIRPLEKTWPAPVGFVIGQKPPLGLV